MLQYVLVHGFFPKDPYSAKLLELDSIIREPMLNVPCTIRTVQNCTEIRVTSTIGKITVVDIGYEIKCIKG